MVNAVMMARLLTCVQFSGSARQYFKFRVTSAQNHLGSEPLLNNGTGVIFGVIHFSVSPLLSVGHPLIDCQNQMFMYPGSVTIRNLYIQGMQDRIENFFEVGSNFTDDGCENDFSLMGVK